MFHMKTLNLIAQWLVRSSADPARLSLTIKGILVGVVPVIMAVAGLANIDIGSDKVSAIIDGIASLVQVVLALVAMVMTAYGIVRKLYNTITGRIDVPQE